ncbi:MAG: hypothetical protein C0594_06635, partial [Marinilabiliales bacterium]
MCNSFAFGQDPQFTQGYAIPLYLAPSFAGTTAGSRVSLAFRDQWPAATKLTGDREYVTYAAAYDHYFPTSNSGLGVIFMQDNAGMGALTSTSIGVQYSYNFLATRKLQIRPALEFSYHSKSINISKLTFGDQLSFYGNRPTSLEGVMLENFNYTDFAASVLFYHVEFWAGFSVNNLAQSNQSITADKSILPTRLTVFGGKKIITKGRRGSRDEESVTLSFLYKSQAKFDQLDIGFYWSHKPLVLGIWYRGLPFIKSYQNYINNDAINLLVGYAIDEFTIGYSYDFTISRLISTSGGAHEVTL